MRVTVGRHGTLTADEARKQAARIIARIKAGESPVLDEPVADPTVGDLAERYQREYVAMHCKPATVSHYGLMLRKHIVPALGEHLVREVERKHILEFQYGLSSMPTVANRAVDILVKMFGLAEDWGWRPPGRNPCRLFVRRYKVGARCGSGRGAGRRSMGSGDPSAGADGVQAERWRPPGRPGRCGWRTARLAYPGIGTRRHLSGAGPGIGTRRHSVAT